MITIVSFNKIFLLLHKALLHNILLLKLMLLILILLSHLSIKAVGDLLILLAMGVNSLFHLMFPPPLLHLHFLYMPLLRILLIVLILRPSFAVFLPFTKTLMILLVANFLLIHLASLMENLIKVILMLHLSTLLL